MGLLDDAIREHLDLKRQHGAVEEELRRQETEALGPARRDFAAGEAAAPEVAPPVPSDDAAGGYEPSAEPAGWLDEELDEAPPARDVPARAEPLEHAAEVAEPAPGQAPPPDEPFSDPPPPRRSETPTQGFDALSRDDEPADDGEDDEDVLEETPDFLQDTPEHDRLWFEQKPPRDFDFDG